MVSDEGIWLGSTEIECHNVIRKITDPAQIEQAIASLLTGFRYGIAIDGGDDVLIEDAYHVSQRALSIKEMLQGWLGELTEKATEQARIDAMTSADWEAEIAPHRSRTSRPKTSRRSRANVSQPRRLSLP
jgi:hypothetical protein